MKLIRQLFKYSTASSRVPRSPPEVPDEPQGQYYVEGWCIHVLDRCLSSKAQPLVMLLLLQGRESVRPTASLLGKKTRLGDVSCDFLNLPKCQI